jgi:hypothetical protein
VTLQVTLPQSLPVTLADPALFKHQPGLTPVHDVIADITTDATTSATGAVGSSLAALAGPPCGKAESVVSVASQCSYSSTVVHVGDKKLQPGSGIHYRDIDMSHSTLLFYSFWSSVCGGGVVFGSGDCVGPSVRA